MLDRVITADLLMLNCVTTTTVKLTTVNLFKIFILNVRLNDCLDNNNLFIF